MFKFLHGPLFANVILADEINRTPPKTQAALLEAMQERQVTVGGTRHRLPDPFFVLATQNPIEQEGTYPLPEAQQDRFMFNILVDYPEEEEEFRIVEMTTTTHLPQIERMLSATDILEMQDIVRKVPVAPYVIRYAMKFTRLTRKEKGQVPDFIKDYVTWGAGPRATQFLVLAAKARAVLHQLQRRGRGHQARRHRAPADGPDPARPERAEGGDREGQVSVSPCSPASDPEGCLCSCSVVPPSSPWRSCRSPACWARSTACGRCTSSRAGSCRRRRCCWS